jgi:hypothetical protein
MRTMLRSLCSWSLAMLTVAALGCRGCEEDAAPSPATTAAAPVREAQTEQARLRSRLTARNLDHSKSYPKNPDGSVNCGSDADCLLIQSEHCSKAVLNHVQTMSAYGLEERIQTRYTLGGEPNEGCTLRRETLGLEVKMVDSWRQLMKHAGKTDEEIDLARQSALDALNDENPPRLECVLADELLLEALLDVAENLYDPMFWHQHCTEPETPNRGP